MFLLFVFGRYTPIPNWWSAPSALFMRTSCTYRRLCTTYTWVLYVGTLNSKRCNLAFCTVYVW